MRMLLAVCFLLPSLAFGQGGEENGLSGSKIDYYVNLFSQADGRQASAKDLSGFVQKLEQKRPLFTRTEDFLEYVFLKTHQRFLKRYSDYVSFSQMLEKRNYNCLTGTALYAVLLDHFGIPYRVIETNYHIFLITDTAEGRVLIETTDPINGFVTDAGAIEERIKAYRKNDVQETNYSKKYYRYNFNLYHEVDLDQMVGLLHYNLAVQAFNNQELQETVDELSKAILRYNSPRIDEFSKLVLLSVRESNLDPSIKAKCINEIQSLTKAFVVTARTN